MFPVDVKQQCNMFTLNHLENLVHITAAPSGDNIQFKGNKFPSFIHTSNEENYIFKYSHAFVGSTVRGETI